MDQTNYASAWPGSVPSLVGNFGNVIGHLNVGLPVGSFRLTSMCMMNNCLETKKRKEKKELYLKAESFGAVTILTCLSLD